MIRPRSKVHLDLGCFLPRSLRISCDFCVGIQFSTNWYTSLVFGCVSSTFIKPQNPRFRSQVGMGPSTTTGRGCPNLNFRWTDRLENFSNFTGSPLRLQVINRAKPATPLSVQWQPVLKSYQQDETLDLIVIDYAVTSTNVMAAKSTARLIHSFLETWKRPPALLFLETFSLTVLNVLAKGKTSACRVAADFEETDPFYSVLKGLQIPALSYPDIACQMAALNRTTRPVGLHLGTKKVVINLVTPKQHDF